MPEAPVHLAVTAAMPEARYAGEGLAPRVDAEVLQRRLAGRGPVARSDYAVYRGSRVLQAWRRLEQALTLDLWLAHRVRRALTADGRRDPGAPITLLSTSERVGLPLAMLLGRRPVPGLRHVMIGHYLASPRKAGLLRRLCPLDHVDLVICLSVDEERFLRKDLGLPAERVLRLRHTAVDARFFSPTSGVPPGHLLSVGRAERDFATLFAAVDGAPYPVKVLAHSSWDLRYNTLDGLAVPGNVEIVAHQSASALRDLYACAFAVAVPLLDRPHFTAGISVAQEAMAMGRPVVATGSTGMREYVPAEAARFLAPGDAAGWRDALRRLWADEAERRALGEAGRRHVEAGNDLDAYVDQLVAALAGQAGVRP